MSGILRLAWLYDADGCRCPTGVTRHALALRQELLRTADLQVTSVTGQLSTPEGQSAWDSWSDFSRVQLPVSTRQMIRLWRVLGRPRLDRWTGPIDWVYCPSEYFVPTGRSLLAVTSHDILQDISFGGPRRQALLARIFRRASLIASVSHYNSSQLLDAFPHCHDRVVYVPNAADELFHEPASELERVQIRSNLGLSAQHPFLLSVANFQPRKNLERLLRAAIGLPEVAQGDLALVLVGSGSDEQIARLSALIAELPRGVKVIRPGYLEGIELRAAYAEAKALVFPSTCESFGIPAVEAMAQCKI